MAADADRWSRWLLEGRDAGDERQRSVTLDHLAPIRDRVLDHGEPLEGATLLDVGAGDGLIGVEALRRVGPRGKVIFSDVSVALLERCRRSVSARGLLDRADFVEARAEDLAQIANAAVDIATTRSVLIYVADKADAFAALHRVLRPGGRISLFEPINRLMFPEAPERFWGYEIGAVSHLADRIKATYAALAAGANAPMMDFDDRDLLRLAETAGFEHIHLQLHVDVAPDSTHRTISLDALLDTAPNPLAPTLRQSIGTALSRPERDLFLAHLERAFVEGRHVRRSAAAYLTARKP